MVKILSLVVGKKEKSLMLCSGYYFHENFKHIFPHFGPSSIHVHVPVACFQFLSIYLSLCLSSLPRVSSARIMIHMERRKGGKKSYGE